MAAILLWYRSKTRNSKILSKMYRRCRRKRMMRKMRMRLALYKTKNSVHDCCNFLVKRLLVNLKIQRPNQQLILQPLRTG